jgi:Neutral/alkaline non-lysosomal ceramidase, N-terminal
MSAAEYNDPRLKDLPTRKAVRAGAVAVLVPLALVGVASLPWRGEPAAGPPRVLSVARGSGGLSAGAAEVPFVLPERVPIGGFARFSYESVPPAGPVGARALVLASPGCKVALASAELLLVPEELEAAVEARVADLGLNGIVLAATHTHAGPGGYWDHAVGERIATGPFDPKVRDAIVAAIADAIRGAAGALAPARVAVARDAADDLARSRSGGLEDAPITALRIDRPDGAPVAEVTVFAAHATLLGKRNRAISGDWPGRFLARGAHGMRLFLQGALGDQSADGPSSSRGPDAYAAALSERVDALAFGTPDAAPPVAFAAAALALPDAEPGAAPALLRPAARNVLSGADPHRGRDARVEALRIGPALLVAVPAEPVARVASRWREGLPDGTAVVSLGGGYLGYVEAPERMADGAGETARTYYGPALADRLGAAVRAAAFAAYAVAPAATK